MNKQFVLIVGFTRRTSFTAAKALLRRGNTVLLSDTVSDNEKLSMLRELESIGPVINLLGSQSQDILSQHKVNMVLPSPGVPLTIPLIRKAAAMNIPVIGDIELFYRMHNDSTYIGITGTDGKTTTTTLTHEIVKSERQSLIGGNVGIPIFEYEESVRKDSTLILELSSFQLEAIERFHPKVAAVLNIAEDHLDRYDSVQSYMLAKKNIFKNQQSSDFAVLNLDSPYFEALRSGVKSQIQTFSLKSNKADCYFKDGIIFYQGKNFIERDQILLRGIHNVENSMAAILMAKAIGIPDIAIQKTLSRFQGLEHRLEFVRKIGNVEFYNDSKSTTVNSLEKALMSFDKPIVLIAGGRDKGLDFTLIRDLAHKKLKELVLIGEAADKIKNELGFEPHYKARSLEDAIDHANHSARQNDVVLFSPGCASFDMFKNYEERGKKFKELTLAL